MFDPDTATNGHDDRAEQEAGREQTRSIRDVFCPDCQAVPGEPCTRPTDTDRKPVRWFHLARESAAITPAPVEFARGDNVRLINTLAEKGHFIDDWVVSRVYADSLDLRHQYIVGPVRFRKDEVIR